jgi:hypothetical protein
VRDNGFGGRDAERAAQGLPMQGFAPAPGGTEHLAKAIP